jgi:hypothetical protein
MLNPDLYKPIRNFGFLFFMLGLCGFLVLLTKLYDIEHIFEVWLFIGIISLFHLLLGVGIINKSRLGFGVFKSYLRLMYLVFPIGTYISRKTLEYIEKNNIERYLN